MGTRKTTTKTDDDDDAKNKVEIDERINFMPIGRLYSSNSFYFIVIQNNFRITIVAY